MPCFKGQYALEQAAHAKVLAINADNMQALELL
jgi:hypothetical protein